MSQPRKQKLMHVIKNAKKTAAINEWKTPRWEVKRLNRVNRPQRTSKKTAVAIKPNWDCVYPSFTANNTADTDNRASPLNSNLTGLELSASISGNMPPITPRKANHGASIASIIPSFAENPAAPLLTAAAIDTWALKFAIPESHPLIVKKLRIRPHKFKPQQIGCNNPPKTDRPPESPCSSDQAYLYSGPKKERIAFSVHRFSSVFYVSL